MLKNQKFTYRTAYTLQIRSGLKPKYGTEPLIQDMLETLSAPYFVDSIEAFQNVVDHSGVIIDTKSYGTD